MSVSTCEISTVRDLMFMLKNVNPDAPIVPAKDNPAGPVMIELHWTERPDNAHYIRIGEVRDE